MTRSKIQLFVFIFAAAAALGLAQQVVEEIVAIVNDEAITLTQFKHEYDLRLQSAQAQYKGEDLDKWIAQARTGLLEAIITDTLILQMAKVDNTNVTDQVKMALENIKKENNLESDDDLKRAVQSQGMEWDAFVKQIEERMMRESVIYKEVNRSIVLDDAQVVDFYKKNLDKFVIPDEFKLRAIYLSTVEASAVDLEVRKKAIDDKLKAGADFAELSGAESDVPMKESKGDLGTLKRPEMEATLLAAVEKLKKGETSPWVTAKNGLYLLRLEDKKDSRQLTFDEARKQIEDRLFAEKQNAKVAEFLTNLKKKSYIKILKPNPIGN
jgi:peptidyl-prolyl cis-trans isomerase SurA